MKKRIVLSLIIFFSASFFLWAQETAKVMEKNAREAYKLLLKDTDKNNDGKISKVEFYAIWKDKKIAEEKYKTWEVNKDGYITEEEYVKVVLNIGKKKK